MTDTNDKFEPPMRARRAQANEGGPQMTRETDLIRRIDAMQATQVGPSDEWAKATKSGYNQASTDIAMNIMKLPAAPAHVVVKPLVWVCGWAGENEDVPRLHGMAGFGYEYGFTAAGYGFSTHEEAPEWWVSENKAMRERMNAARVMAAIDVQPPPDVSKVLAQARTDAVALGTGWIRVTPEGTLQLIDPSVIRLMPPPDVEHVPLHPDDLFQNPSPDDPSLAENIQHVLESAKGPQHWFTAPDVAALVGRDDAIARAERAEREVKLIKDAWYGDVMSAAAMKGGE